ncbi:MAG TPA: hypothetical protein VFO31_20680, partial [Vicinamibacterales bacterium]|nr:hypothetical protein [Vicinamibacterales bacterium]
FDAGNAALTRGVTFAELSIDAIRRALASLRDGPAEGTDLACRVDEAISVMASDSASAVTDVTARLQRRPELTPVDEAGPQARPDAATPNESEGRP